MNTKNYYEWLFADLDEIIDCEFNSTEEENKSEQNGRERFIEAVNDIGKSGEHNSK